MSNNVGQHNAAWTNAPFEVRPWAIGQTTNAAPGELVPEDSTFTFDVDLADPLIAGYLAQALDEGRLRLMVNSLSPAVQITPGGTGGGGIGNYPQWSTRKNILYAAPRLELEGVAVTDADTDHDGLPDDWERFWSGDLSLTADGDPDSDDLSNHAEFIAGTDPADRASALRILASRFEADGNAVVRFPIAASRNYRVEVSEDLASWSEGSGRLTFPERGIAEWTEQNPAAGPAVRPIRFYRVVVE